MKSGFKKGRNIGAKNRPARKETIAISI